MKILPFFAWILLMFSGALQAAPRLVVSTPSLLPESEIDIVFGQPMVKPEELGKETPNDLISTSPELAGKLFWKSPTIAQFKLDGVPTIGTKYVFSARKGLKYLDGSAVEPGEFAKVSSEAFRIHTSRIHDRYSSNYSPATASWMIVFNDEVEPAVISGFFSFSSEKNQRVAPNVRHATAEEAGYLRTRYLTWNNRNDPGAQRANVPAESLVKNIIRVAPNSPLPVAQKWELLVLKGLPNAGETATLAQDASYRIGVVEPFKYERVSADVSVNTPRRISVKFNRALPDDFDPELVSVSPKPEAMSVEIDGRFLRVVGDFSPHDNYVLNLAKGIVSGENQKLSNPSSNIKVKFQRLEAELALPSEDEAQLAHGQRKYAISTVNLAEVSIRIKALSGKGMIRAFQGYRSYSGRGPDYSQVEPTSVIPYSLIPGETIVEKEIKTGITVDTGKMLEISWDELLPKGHKYSTLFIDVTGTPHEKADSRGRRNAQAIVQLTDIGLVWKFTEKSALVFAFSCNTGKPLQNVKIGIYGEDANRLEEVATDANGMATVSRNDKVRHLSAVFGKDSYTVAFDDTLDQVGMWHFPVRHSWMKQIPEKRRAFLFTERSLYRPGEIVRIKGIVRNQHGNTIVLSEEAPARIVIIDPKDKEVFTAPVEISALGSFDITYTLPGETTGDHTIKLEFPDDLEIAEKTEDWQEQIALEQSASFSIPLKVEEFRRNTFEIAQEIVPPAIGAGEVSVQLGATYYQGQPVAAGKAVTFSEVTDSNPYPERYRDFLFGDHKVDDWRYWYNYFGYRDRDGDNDVTSSIFNSDLVLSEGGQATIPLTLPKSDFPATRKISVSTEVTDANNQTLTARSTATVHPAALYAGISRVDRLIRVGEETPFRLVVIDTEGNPATEDITLTAAVTRQVHTTIKTTNAKGETVTESKPREELISTVEVVVPATASAKEGLPFPVVPANTGLHYLTLKGKDSEGREFATVTRFHAYGAKEYPWQYEEGMRIKLVSEKKSYRPGDTARVLVLSPIEGTALVTVEREKVLHSYLTELKADNPVIEIPITDEHAPNAFVSILIVKGSAESAREIKAPQLRLGYCELTVENQRDRLAVEISKPAESYRPGTEVALSGKVATAEGKPASGAEVILYAVDEGTLAVMGYDTPDPMGFFYDPRMLSVDAGTSFHNFITENEKYRSFHNKGFFIGGGGDLNKLTELFRKNFDPCATWAPTLVTDTEGRFSHTFTLPDTLTRYRVIAIAHHGGAKFGHSESAILVKKPLMLEPKLPRFAHQGDTINAQVLVQNSSEKSATWEVAYVSGSSSESSAASLIGAPVQSLTLAPGESDTLIYPIEIHDTGIVKVAFSAKPLSLSEGDLTPDLVASLSDAVEETFSSYFPMPLLRQVSAICVTPSESVNVRELLSKELQSATGSIELQFATSPLVEVSSSINYLLKYPYGCAEQTSSSLMPWFAVNNLRPYIPAFAKKTEAEVADAIAAGVSRLLSMQQADGSFGYWPGASSTNDWVTPYAGMALTLASQNGGNVPPSALESLGQYLIKSLRGAGEAKTSYELENHARTLYTLALLGKAQPPYHALMAEKLPGMSDSARGLLAAAIATSSEGAPKILSFARSVLDSKVKFETLETGGYWSPGNSSQATDLIALLAIDSDSTDTHKALDRLLNDRNPYGHWRSTWVNGWSLLAISQYASYQSLSDDAISISLETSDGLEEINLTKKSPTDAISIPLTPVNIMSLKTSAPAYLRIKVAAKPAIAPVKPVATNGLSIDRFYEKVLPSGQTEVLTQPALGDLIRVTLRISLPKDDTRYLVVDDPLPAIFETVNSDFASQSSGQKIRTSERDWTISHSELRSDRAVFFMDKIRRKGTYEITYLARCTIAGSATAPPAKAESMYEPENYALSASQKFSN